MLKILNKSYFETAGNLLNQNSQLHAFNLLKDTKENQKLLNIFRCMKIREISDEYCYNYEMGYDEWWDNIANNFYGTPILWWVIPLINEITNPFEMPEAGTNIKILKEDFLYILLNEWKGLSEK